MIPGIFSFQVDSPVLQLHLQEGMSATGEDQVDSVEFSELLQHLLHTVEMSPVPLQSLLVVSTIVVESYQLRVTVELTHQLLQESQVLLRNLLQVVFLLFSQLVLVVLV